MPDRARAALLAVLCLSGPALAQAPPKPRPPAPPAAADPAFEAAKAAFEALPEAERKGLQDALVWTGDYNSTVAGTFGRRTFEGLNAYRARTGTQADALDPRTRAAILAAGEAARRNARFVAKPDPASGAVIGVPERLLSKRSPVPGGTRWQSPDGRVTLETRSYAAGGADLDGLFERATAPVPDRKVTYKLKRPDFIVVTGETAGGRSYLRYAAGPAGIRGFTMAYDAAMAAEIDRLVIAVANSFVPFPDAAPAEPAAEVPRPEAGRPSALPSPPTARQAAATGLVVAPGRVLTASTWLDTCPAPRIGAAPARLVRGDGARGIALLEASGLPAPVPLAARADPVAADERLVVVAAGAGGLSVAPGSGTSAGVLAPLQPGAVGAPVLDRSGRLAGLVARYPLAPRLVAGVVPPASLPLVPGATVAAFLAENGIAPASAPARGEGTLGAVAGAVGPAVVEIGCAR